MEKKASRPRGSSAARLCVMLLALVLLSAALTVPAMAATKPTVNATTKSVTTAVGNTIVFGTDGVFTLNGDPKDVRYMEVKIDGAGNYDDIRATHDGGDWEVKTTNYATTFTLASSGAMTREEITRNIGLISVRYASSYYSSYSARASVTIKFHSSQKPNSNSRDFKTFNDIELSFKNFAKGSLEAGDVGYEAEDGNGTYLDGFVVSEGGVATGKVYITNYGNANRITVGYQVKESTNTSWLNIETHTVLENGYAYYMKDLEYYSKRYGTSDAIKKLTACMDESDKVNIRLEGFKAGVNYDIRGVIITDGQTSYPVYTNAITVRYDKPTVNSFNVGSTNGPQEGGSARDISLLATFNNTNYDNTYHSISGQGTALGPVVKATVYFTDNFRTSTVDVNGTQVRQDGSTWTQVGEDRIIYLQSSDTDGNPIYNRSINETWAGIRLPKADSKSAAYKVVLTDMISGFEVYSVSPSFVVDQNPPTDPQIWTLDSNGDPATDESGNNIVLGIGPGQLSTVGGSNAKVTLGIAGSTDAASGMKEYSYSMYYYSTADGSGLGSTTEAVLQRMKGLSESNLSLDGKTVTYTPSTALKLQTREQADGSTRYYSTLAISKDGFYRVDVAAKDGMGRSSRTITSVFRVDLSQPSTPEVALVARFRSDDAAVAAGHLTKAGRGINGSTDRFYPYDNRTYSTNEVWACLYAAPQTGKTIVSYEYSRDGGLSWIDVPVSTIAMSGSAPRYYTKDAQVGGSVVRAYNDNYIDDMTYDAAIRVSSDEVSGYQNYIFRTVDSLGNTSLTSEPVIMRTTDEVQANGVLSHQGIEVAMSLGDTDVESSLVTPELKNRAARKINEDFYGTTGSTTLGADDFNPYLYTKGHNCTWAESDPGCTTPCTDVNCPFATMQEKGYAIYTPEMVNVQGISQQSAQGGVSNWIEYDHNTLRQGCYYNASGKTSGTWTGYSKSDVAGKTAGIRQSFSLASYNPSNSNKGRLAYHADQYMTNTQPTDITNLAAGAYDYDYKSSSFSRRYTYAFTCQQRARHFLDYSTLAGIKGADGKQEAPYTTLLAVGYSVTPLADWKFLENDQSAKKTLTFTIDTNACDTHTYSGGGFLFNSTIRPNSSGTWVVSGWAVYVYQYSSIQLYQLREYPVATWADGGRITNGTYTTQKTSIATPSGVRIFNFNILTEGTKTSVYWIGGAGHGESDPEAFAALRQSIGNTTPASTTFTYKGNALTGGVAFYKVETGRPTINNTVPNDTNIYGFGPFIQYDSHSCGSETHIFYSNITMSMNVVRRLSEVVTEPHWGSGKGKYILNINNEPTSDFEDPAMATAIQWRLNNDNARFIGWGKQSNQTQTEAFLDRIRISADTTGMSSADAAAYLKAGMYETVESHGGDTKQQLDDIAEYISRQYYGAFGITDFSKPVSESMKGSISGSVPVYALEDAGSINFEVTPAAYNSSTANADYPSGRWYIVHDTTGYDGVTPIARNKQYSDALDLAITKPGRYMIYFAPTAEDVENNTLDPSNAVFHFIVNQKPEARFGGQIVATEVQDQGKALTRSDGTAYTDADIDAYLDTKWTEALNNGTVIAVPDAAPTTYCYAADASETPRAVTGDEITQAALEADIETGWIQAIPGDTTTYKWTVGEGEAPSSGATAGAAGTAVDLTVYAAEVWNAAIALGIIEPYAGGTHYEYAGKPGVAITKESFKADYKAANIKTKSGVVRLVDNSADADANGAPMASQQTYSYVNASGATVSGTYNKGEADAQLNGKYKVEWSYDISFSTGTGNTQKLVVVGTAKDNTALNADGDGWTTKSLDGMTIKELITNSSYKSWDNLQDGAVLTVYQRVTDISARLEAKYNVAADGKKTFVGYRYVNNEAGGTALMTTNSGINQRNISATASVVREVTSAPLSAMTLSSTTMYDTAAAGTADIRVSRHSSHPQNKDFILSWAIPVGADYVTLEPYTRPDGCTNYYLNLKKDSKGAWVGLSYDATKISGTAGTASNIDPTIDPKKNTSSNNGATTTFSTYARNQGYTTRYPILTGVTPEKCTYGSASGEWIINKTTIKTLVEDQKIISGDTVLQINESIKGYAEATSSEQTVITDHSARAIGFKKDTNPPTAQTVSVSTKRYQLTDGNAATNTSYDDESIWKSETYQASNYLDITAHDAFNRLTIGGSADNEGALGGYGYYFYTTKTDSSGNVVEDKWYNFKTVGGVLTRTPNYAAGSTDAVNNALIKMSADSLTNNLFTVDITEKMMDADAGSASFNVAIFAYDTQTGQKTYTGANQSAVTKVENIKLTQSTPMPPAIKVTDSMNNVVSQIGNDAAFNDAADGATDTMTTGVNGTTGESMNFWSNTEVTVQFLPRQGYFVPDPDDGDRLVAADATAAGAATYYVDKYHQADLTNMAEVTYTLYQKQGANWQVYSIVDSHGDTIAYQDIHINAATTVSVKDSGEYKVEAIITNGAGIVSEMRAVEFSLDVRPPTDPVMSIEDTGTHVDYNSNSWTKEVVISLSGSNDNNNDSAYYAYSLDNGATWTELAKLNENGGNQVLVINGTGNTSRPGAKAIKVASGEYQLRVKAVDKAGNESVNLQQVIKIDVDGPVISEKDLVMEAQSVVVRVYNEFVVSTSVSTGGSSGTIWPVYNGKVQTDSIVSLPTLKNSDPPVTGSQLFRITPATGYIFHDLVLNGVSVKGDAVANGDGSYNYTLNALTKDSTLAVSFQSSSAKTNLNSTEVKALFADTPITVMSTGRRYMDGSSNGVGDNAGRSGGTYTIIYGVGAGDGYGEIVPDGGGTGGNVSVAAGGSVTFSITPNEDSCLSSLKVGTASTMNEIFKKGDTTLPEGMTKTTSGYTYTFTNVGEDMYLSASFDIVPTYTVTVKANRHGTVTATGYGSTSTGDNGETLYEIYEGRDLRFTLTPESAKYVVSSIKVDGVAQDASAPLAITNITADHTVEIVFDVSPDTPSQYVTVKMNNTSEKTMGTAYPAPDSTLNGQPAVKVPLNDNLHVTFAPLPGYYLAGLKLVNARDIQTGELQELRAGRVATTQTITGSDGKETTVVTWTDTGVAIDTIAQDNKDGTYTVTFSRVAEDSFSVEAYFAVNTWTITQVGTSTGGSLNFSAVSGGGVTLNGNAASAEQGTTVRVTATPQEGYRLSGITVDGIPVGAQTPFDFNSISSNHTIEATFTAKKLAATTTTHGIVVEANNIRDEHDKLADQAYRFQLCDATGAAMGAYSAWQASSIYTFTGLDPNVRYTVNIQAQDAAGNVSTSSKAVYTLANIPSIISVNNVNSENEDNKSVQAVIDSNGNPEGTRYMVYYSERADMQSDVFQTSEEFQELGENGTIDVGHLGAGRRYYLQVRAMNGDGKETGVDEDNIPSILLTPTSPPAGSLYVSEQESPLGGVTLTWADPNIEVSGFELYRNGQVIYTATKTDRTYTDPYAGLHGDEIYSYSYAYVNGAGIGSSRSAVIKDYHDADDAGKAKLDNLVKGMGNDETIFSEVLTYPAFPSGVEVIYNSPEDNTQYSGKLQVRVLQDSAKMNRYGSYTLELLPYAKDGDGNYTVLVSEPSDFAKYGVSAADISKYNPQTTVTVDSRGAIATWTGLNTDFEYQVRVQEVKTTGAPVFTMEEYWYIDEAGNKVQGQRPVYSNGYGGKNSGVEGKLLKEAYVNSRYFETTYSFGAYDPQYVDLLSTGYGFWASEAEATAYTGGHGWSTPLKVTNVAEGAKIKFNKTPQIELPASASDIYGTPQQIVTDLNGTYLLIDKTNTTTEEQAKIIIRVAAWDEDGGPVTITGRIGGTWDADTQSYVGGLVGKTEEITNVHTSKADARNGYYDIVFDGRQLSAGVYDNITLTIDDGQLLRNVDIKDIKIVVNQALPNVYITGGNGTRKIEQGGIYDLDDVIVTSTSLNSNVDSDVLRPLRLVILRDKYVSRYNTNVEANIITQLTTPSSFAKYKTYCQTVLGKDYDDPDSGYLNASKDALTVDGAKAVIDREPLEVNPYFEVSETDYNSAKTAGYSDELAFMETTTDSQGNEVIRYWMDVDVALQRNACEWAVLQSGSSKFKVTGVLGDSYALRLVTHFGKNTSHLITYFRVLEPPKIKIHTDKTWGWQEAVQEEYMAYADERYYPGGDKTQEPTHIGTTVQDAYDHYQGTEGSAVRPTEAELPASSKAYRVVYKDGTTSTTLLEGDESKVFDHYEIFRLVDKQATVGSDYIVGNVDVDSGIYDKLYSVGLLVTTDANYDPNTDGGQGVESKYMFNITDPNAGPTEDNTHIGAGSYTFKTSGLQADQNYCLWTYYTYVKPDGSVSDKVFQKDYVVFTTRQIFTSATYTFDVKELSYKEVEATPTDASKDYQEIQVPISRLGDLAPSAVLNITAEYLEADEYGNVLLDDAGNPVPLKSSSGAPKTLLLANGSDRIEMTNQAKNRTVYLKLYNDAEKQGHMVVRLHMTIDYSDPKTELYNYIAVSGDMVDIFVLDDESPITNYKLGIRNSDEGDANHLTVVNNESGQLDHYEFNYPGLQVGYTISSELVINYFNAGTGDLSNIKIDIYDEKKQELSKYFMATQPPYSDTLAGGSGDLGSVRVMAKAGLPDGVHYAWLRLYAKNMDPRDEVWIKVCQVVGQSTISGKIYIGKEVPTNSLLRTGSATVYLYSSDTEYNPATKTFSTKPLAVVKSSEYGGDYVVPNILNNGSYYIVVERPGFLTYNSVAANKLITIKDTSLNLQLNIRLLAGDVCGSNGSLEPDNIVDENDLNAFNTYFNWNLLPLLEKGTLTETDQMILRCDFNGDYYLSNLDIASIYANMYKTSLDYTYEKPTLISEG